MSAQQIKVSIADDHKIFREGIKMALKDRDYLKILWEAEDGKDLMHKLRLKQPDILLMDIRMPLMDGEQAARLIRRGGSLDLPVRDALVPIIALTANATDLDRARYRGRPVSHGESGCESRPARSSRLRRISSHRQQLHPGRAGQESAHRHRDCAGAFQSA